MLRPGHGHHIVRLLVHAFVRQNRERHRFLGVAVISQILVQQHRDPQHFPDLPDQRGIPASAPAHDQRFRRRRAEVPHRHPDALRGKPGRRCQDVLPPQPRFLPAPHDLVGIRGAVDLPPRGFGRLHLQPGIRQHPCQQPRVPFSFRGHPAVPVIALPAFRDPSHNLVHHHVPGAGIKGQRVLRSASRRQHRQIPDPADVLQPYGLLLPAVQQVFRIRHQGRPLSAGGKVPRPEIADHRAAQSLGDHRGLPQLQRSPDLPARVRHRLRLVKQRLSVTAHQIHRLRRDAGLLAHRPAGLQPHLAHQEGKQAQIPAASRFSAGQPQNLLPDFVRIGQAHKGHLPHPGLYAAAADLRQRRVHAVRGSPAHQADHPQRGFFP